MDFLKPKRRSTTGFARTAAVVMALLPGLAAASGGAPLPKQEWGFKGIFGKFDNAALKRGAQVTIEVCMGCHSVKYIQFDHLRKIGFTETEVKALAESAGRNKKDKMLSAMDPQTAKESFGTQPPDLSLITKARKGYEDYTYGILTGYLGEKGSELVGQVMEDQQLLEPEIKRVAEALHLHGDAKQVKGIIERISNGENFNAYFPGHFLAMPPPLSAGQVEFADGTEATLPQMAHDVTSFLAWAAEPTLMERKSVGIRVEIYLIILTIMLYTLKRRIWAKVH